MDIKTLFLANAVADACMAFALCLYLYRRKVYPGFRTWTAATAAIFIGGLFLGLRGQIPDSFSILVESTAYPLSAVWRLAATQAFLSLARASGRWYLFPVLTFVFCAYLHFGVDLPHWRVMIVALATAIPSGYLSLLLIRHAPRQGGLLHRIMGGVLLFLMLVVMVRAFLIMGDPHFQLLEASFVSIVFILLMMPTNLLLNMFFIMLNSQRQEAEFLQAQSSLEKSLEKASIENQARNLAEDNLIRSESFLNAVGRIAKVGGWEMDAQTLVVNWTEETYRIHEVSLGVNLPLEDAINFFHPEDRPLLQQAIQDALEHGTPYDMTIRLTTATGKQLWTKTICHPVMVAGKVVKLIGTVQDLTELKQAEAELRASEAQYRALFNQARDAIIVMEIPSEGMPLILDANDAALRMHGYSLDEIVGKPVSMLDAEEPPAEVTKERVGQLQNADGLFFETRHIRKDGSIFDCEISVRMFNESMAIDITRDISDRKRTEDIIHTRLSLLQRAPSLSLPDLLRVTIDEVCRITGSAIGFYHFVEPDQQSITLQAWSTRTMQEFCKAEGQGLHYDIDQGGVWLDCVREGRPVIHNDYASLAHKKGMPPGHAPVIREVVTPIFREGRMVAILGVGNKEQPYTDEDADLVGYLADVAWEIVQSKRAEQERTLTSQRMESLLNLNHIRELDLDKLATFAMEEAVRLTESKIGYISFVSEDESKLTMHAWSKEAMKLCGIEGKPVVYKVKDSGLWGEAIRQRRPIVTNNYRAPNTHKKGLPAGHVDILRHMNVPIFDGDRIVLVAGVGNKEFNYDDNDVRQMTLLMQGMWKLVQQKRFEEEKASLEAQLRHAHKMQAMGSLADGVAHEFNNLLASIMGFAELAQDGAQGRDDILADLAQIIKAGERGRDLVRKILSFSRTTKTEARPTDLNREILESIEIIQRMLPKMVTIETRLEPNLKTASMEANHTNQILANLASNSAHAMPNGGILTIKTENVFIQSRRCPLCGEDFSGDYIMLSVSDTGQGMDEQTLLRVFEPFFSTKEVGSGQGLGLSVVQGLVKSNQGHIEAQSALGQGTTVRIYLPVLTTPSDMSAIDDLPNGAPEGGTQTILLVDDEETLRQLGQRSLERMGYKTYTAQSGEEALDIYQDNAAEIGLVVLDIGMPGIGGKRCLQELLKLNSALKVIVASGYASQEQMKEFLAAGAVAFVGKPFKKAELLSTVRRVLDTK